MWKFNPFTKEPTGLEGRTIDVGTIKVTVRSPIAEGGFSCVYLARDATQPSKQYALKHMICNDEESMEIVMREIGVLRGLSGHPNVVRMVSHAVFDMGRTKEAMLVMEYCEKSLVGVLEGRGGEWFEEREVMVVFRDVCNAVRAMHQHSPPIAHRDLKAENILLGSDGAWKLCDFGSTSTNHKCFSKPEEMGLEEDNIRKHTTPAYRAPEMWDLFRREVISEKVDIWALGCLLYRICYLKSAFDGESKLQVLNGNYQIPDSPKYSASTIGLIKSMLQASPDARPDITQVCFRVNQQLPLELRMHISDDSLLANGLHSPAAVSHEGSAKKTTAMPRGSPPSSSYAQIRKIPPPSEKEMQNSRPLQGSSHLAVGGGGGGGGGKDRGCSDKQNTLVRNQNYISSKPNPPSEHQVGGGYPLRQSASVNSSAHDNGFEVKFSEVSKHCSDSISRKVELEAEVKRLKEQLEKTVFEKAEITSKYENLSAICHSQHQVLQELKRAHSSVSSSHTINGNLRNQMRSTSLQSSIPQRDKIGGLWELEQGMFVNSSASANQDSKTWQAFTEEPSTQPMPHALYNNHVGSVWTSSSRNNSTTQPAAAGHPNNGWSFGMDNLAWPSGVSPISACIQSSTSQRSNGGEVKGVEIGQPAGWAGF